MYKTFNIVLDTKKDAKNYPFTINSNDLNTPKLIIKVMQDGQPVILNGATVRLAIQKPDGTRVFIDGTVTNGAAGECEFVLTTQSYIARGSHHAEVMIYYTEDHVAVTGVFNYQVKLGIFNDDAIKSTNEFQAINRFFESYPILSESIKGTTQSIVFNADETVQRVQHKDIDGKLVREDVFTYTENLITEVRALSSGSSLTFKYHLDTLETEVL